jgi:hypothetical protein
MIKPGKFTCAGLVVIMMVLPSNLWKSTSARANDRVVSSPWRGIPDNGARNTRRRGRG